MGPHDRGLATRLAELVSRHPKVKERLRITCSGLTDGAGAQAHAVMAALAFSRLTGIRYVHSPFQWMDHFDGDPASWAGAWERFFNLGAGEARLAADEHPVLVSEYLATPSLHDRPCVVTTTRYHEFVERDPRGYCGILHALRERYQLQDKGDLTLHGPDDLLRVAVHIRRGDVRKSQEKRHRKRYTHDRHVLGTIQAVRRALGSDKIVISIYSEGDVADFADYAQLGCDLHINTDPFEAVHNCVSADVFVMAKSSFSYAAAILSEGAKIYEPFWHRPLSGWVIRARNPIERLVKLQGRTLGRAMREAANTRT